MLNYIQKSDNGSDPAVPLPVQPAGVTRAWLESALATRRPGLRLASAAVVDVMPGTSTKIRVKVQPTRGGEDLPAT